MAAAACTEAAIGRARAGRCAGPRSAMLSVPVAPYSMAAPIRNSEEAGEVDRDVVQPGLHPQPARAVQQQAVGGRQQHLEEHEQVEQVRR